MINPFSKRNVLSSKERIKKKAINNITKSIQTKSNNHKSKNVLIKNNKIKRVLNHDMLLKLTKGYFNTNSELTTTSNETNSMSHGKYSYIDFCDVQHIKVNPCCLDTVYILDKCRKKNNLITPQGKIMPKNKERILKYPVPLKKVECCKELPQQYTLPPKIHNIGKNVCHTHYFPTNDKLVSYHNYHGIAKHPCPFPFPNYNSTNFMSTIELKYYNKNKKDKKLHGDEKTFKCNDPKCHVPKCKGKHPRRGGGQHGHGQQPHGHVSDHVINTINNTNVTHDWVKQSKQKRHESQKEEFEDWGTIDHKDFNFDLKNDPYLDLIPEWRKTKLEEKEKEKRNPFKKDKKGHTKEFAVFNNNRNVKIKIQK
jgi:hypothetical protein